LSQAQASLRNRLALAPLPTIPAPRAGFFDLELPPAPPGHERRLHAEAMMGGALAHLEAMARDQALASQSEAIAALKDFDAILTHWSEELAKKSLGVSAQVSDATAHRSGGFEQLESRQIGLLEQTEEAALDEKNPRFLLADQQALLEEVEAFREELSGGESGPAKNLCRFLAASTRSPRR
jgi:hypothetical protein